MKFLSRTLFTAVFCSVLILTSVAGVFATNNEYKVNDINAELSLPTDMLTATRDSKSTDDYFTVLDIDYDKTMTNFTEGNIYLQSIRNDGSLTVTLTMTDLTDNDGITNYNTLTKNQLATIKESYTNDKLYKSCSIAQYNNNTFVVILLNTKVEKNKVQAQQANTVIDGKYYSITMQSSAGKKLTSEDKALMDKILLSFDIVNPSFFETYKDYFIYGGIALAVVILLIIIIVIIVKKVRNPKRRDTEIIHRLSHEHQISETTKIKKDKVSDETYHNRAFLDEYEPTGIKKVSTKKAGTIAKAKAQQVVVSEPVEEDYADDSYLIDSDYFDEDYPQENAEAENYSDDSQDYQQESSQTNDDDEGYVIDNQTGQPVEDDSFEIDPSFIHNREGYVDYSGEKDTSLVTMEELLGLSTETLLDDEPEVTSDESVSDEKADTPKENSVETLNDPLSLSEEVLIDIDSSELSEEENSLENSEINDIAEEFFEDIRNDQEQPQDLEGEEAQAENVQAQEESTEVEEEPVEDSEEAPQEEEQPIEENSQEELDEYDYPIDDEEYDEEYIDKAELRRERFENVLDHVKNFFIKTGIVLWKVIKTIGLALAALLQSLWLLICNLIIHIGYFKTNVSRARKKKRAIKRKQKADAERRAMAQERQKRQREAEMQRRRQNANRGQNDLVKVHSSGERRRPSNQNRRPQQRPQQRQPRPNGSRPRPQQRQSRPNGQNTRRPRR